MVNFWILYKTYGIWHCCFLNGKYLAAQSTGLCYSNVLLLLEAKKPQQWTRKIPDALLWKKQNTFLISRAEAQESFECQNFLIFYSALLPQQYIFMRKVIIAAPSSAAPVSNGGTGPFAAVLTEEDCRTEHQGGVKKVIFLKPNETKRVFTHIIGLPGGKVISSLFESVFLLILKWEFALGGCRLGAA